MIGNYSYSIDDGNTYIVNTINSLINDDPEENPMYSSCVEDINTKIYFGFEDVVLEKGFCKAYFEFLPNSLTQLQVLLKIMQE